ncbi:MAG: class I SAM-dependent methyltransferase [Labilithrix sp.]|nr:class I SAM-dependent methyltransferase [Labilithrix sp.]MCW5835542.1 class I SAM-dependent methyltransferase [Labilithrix sp.]
MLTHRFKQCPLCDASVDAAELAKVADVSSHPSYKPELPTTIRWLRCRSCAHVFTDSYRSEVGDRILFSSALPHQVPDTRQSEHQRNLWAPTVRRVIRCLTEKREDVDLLRRKGGRQPRWADIGFGSGGLLMTADEFGFASLGVDARPEAVKRLQALGYEAVCTAFEALTLDEPLDVLSMADVLEHMPAPRAALDKVRSMLAPDGLFYISCPNSETSTWRLWEQSNSNPYWAEIEHYHNFSLTKLVELLEAHGLRAIDYYVSARYFSCMEVIARREG